MKQTENIALTAIICTKLFRQKLAEKFGGLRNLCTHTHQRDRSLVRA